MRIYNQLMFKSEIKITTKKMVEKRYDYEKLRLNRLYNIKILLVICINTRNHIRELMGMDYGFEKA